MRNKFYKVQEQLNNLHWIHRAYFRKKEDAEKYVELNNAKTVVYPVRVIECTFNSIKDYV